MASVPWPLALGPGLGLLLGQSVQIFTAGPWLLHLGNE